jgi:hypothetical protein
MRYLFFFTSSNAVVLMMPPPIPAKYPSTNQDLKISGEFLLSPLVVNAMEYVNSVVPQKFLDIPPSTYVSGSTVKYNANPVTTCYWPDDLCLQKKDLENIKADIYRCPNDNDWGLTYDDGMFCS